MMTADESIAFILREVTAAGAQGDAIFNQNSTLSFKVEDGALSEYKVASGQSISLRVVRNQRVGTSYSESFESEQLSAMVADALLNAQFTKESPHETIQVSNVRIAQGTDVAVADDITVETKIDTALRLESTLKQKAIPASAPYNGLTETVRTVRVANTLGTDCTHSDTQYACYTSSLIDQDGQQAMHYSMRTADSFSELDVDGCLDEAYETSLDLLRSESLKTGRYDAIFSPDCLASLFAAFGIFVCGESAMKGLNPLRERIGETVGHRALTILNVPQPSGGMRSRPFDDEGHPTQTTTIIEDGTLKSFLHNSMTASFFSVPNTGNASRGGSGLKVAPQHLHILPSNTVDRRLHEGTYLELISVDGMHSGANAISGDFSVGASGYLCKDGERIRAFRGVTVAHNFYDMLRLIKAVGHEAVWNSRRSLSAPEIRFTECNIAGE